MSTFKRAVVKGGSNKEKEPVIDVDDLSPRTKRTHSSSGVFDPTKFRSYAAFQTYENYFKDATPLLERVVDQSSLFGTNIPKWFPIRIGITFFLTLMSPMRIWQKNFMPMQLWKVENSSARLEEKASQSLSHIW